jgi:hypothetical protein
MDVLDLVWLAAQEKEIGEVREQVERARLERDLAAWDLPKVKEVAEENIELKLRLGLLVRLLISKGVISAEEYATLIAAARPQR